MTMSREWRRGLRTTIAEATSWRDFTGCVSFRHRPFGRLAKISWSVPNFPSVIGHFAASADHPSSLAFPEGEYLKGLLLRKAG